MERRRQLCRMEIFAQGIQHQALLGLLHISDWLALPSPLADTCSIPQYHDSRGELPTRSCSTFSLPVSVTKDA